MMTLSVPAPLGTPTFETYQQIDHIELVPAVFKCGVVDSIAISSSLRVWTLASAHKSGIHVEVEL